MRMIRLWNVGMAKGGWSFGKVFPRQHHNPSETCILKYRGKTRVLLISAGTEDSLYVWRQGQYVYVVSYNLGLDYCGLQRFDLLGETVKHPKWREEGEQECYEGEDIVFMQNDYDVKESFPKGLGHYSGSYIRKTLQQWEQ